MDFLHPLLLLLPLLSVCLLSCSGTTSGETVVKVEEGSEAVLPCSIRPERDIRQVLFDWKKDDQEVFFYEKGKHYNNDLEGQDEQFKGRVFHFEDRLQFGDASIRITDTKLSDSGTYSCDISPDQPSRQRFTIELVVGKTVRVEEGSEAVLPCFINPKRNIEREYFNWRKVVQTDNKEVFEYNEGKIYDSNSLNQHEQFKGRVFHFPDQLQSGNASIRINNTKPSDSGNYTCEFPRLQLNRQTFYIELVVGACPKPYITLLQGTNHWPILKCEVQGFKVSRKPIVQWRDSSGNNLTAEETLVPTTGGINDIILKTTVTKTDTYSCVVTQEKICHQVSEKIFVPMPGAVTEPYIKMLDQTKDSALLQCVVRGASPKPKVDWQDSSGNILPAKEPQVTERGGSYDIILNTTVTKTDKYRCVVTQEEINHQTEAETYVHISGSTEIIVAAAVPSTILLVVLVLVVLYCARHRSQRCIKSPQTETERKEQGEPTELDKLEAEPQSVFTDGDRDEKGEPTELDKLEAEPQSV